MDSAELANRFKFHPPTSEATIRAHETVREQCGQLAGFMDATLPESREKSIVMTEIQSVMMWANAAIAIHQKENDQ